MSRLDLPGRDAYSAAMNNPPTLDHDKMMFSRFGHKISARGRQERRVTWNQLLHVEAGGWKVVSLDDGDGREFVDSPKTAMELLFNLDDAYVFVQNSTGKEHWIRFVFGNGVDCVCDYSFSSGDKDGFAALMEAFDADLYA